MIISGAFLNSGCVCCDYTDVSLQESVATTLVNIGNVFKALGRYEEALLKYQEGLLIFRSALGDKHVSAGDHISFVRDRC